MEKYLIKNLKISLNESKKNIIFKLFKTGFKANLKFDTINNDSIYGSTRIRLLNSNFKFKFKYSDNKLNIYESFFRNKNLSFSNESTINYSPFFFINSIIKIGDIDTDLIKSINIDEILKYKNLIKKISTKNEIYFDSKKISNNLIENFYLKSDLAYGRINFLKKISSQESFSLCNGNINLLNEYPILYFDCSLTSKNLKKILKKFFLKYKKNKEIFELKAKGNINITSNKINFTSISEKDYVASKEDLKYFKNLFENILFDENFVKIFNFKKIRNFIQEII